MADYGLVGIGATLVARLLDYPADHYLTNHVIDEQAQAWRRNPGNPGTLQWIGAWTGTEGAPFPYDENVEPP